MASDVVSRIERRWVPPELRLDPETHRSARLAAVMPVIPAVAVVIFGILYLVAVPEPYGRFMGFTLFAGVPVYLASLFLLRRVGSPLLTTALVSLCASIQLLMLSYPMGGILSPALPWLVLVPSIIMIVAGRVAGAVALGLCVTACLGYLLAHPPPGGLPSEFVEPLWFWCTLGLVFCVLLVFWLHEDAKDTAVQQLRDVNRSLVRAQFDANLANRSKTAFLSRMSHEIRTPLTSILGFTEVLSEEVHERANGREPVGVCEQEALSTLRRNGEYLLHIIDDLLDLSRIETETLEVDQRTLDLPQLLRDVLELLEVAAAQRDISLSLELDPALPREIETDPTRVRQVLLNLLGNAIKFTERGSVILRARSVERSGERRVEIVVRDTGIGMSEQQLEKVFRPFGQATRETARLFGGSGLGLVISKRLIEALGGSIRVESHLGVGSTFTVELPAREPSEASCAGTTGGATAPASVEEASPLRGVRLLVVDDSADNRALLSRILARAGAAVELAESGERALECVAAAEAVRRPFDVILMDVQMPGLDGIEATLRLRKRGCESIIVALTADALASTRERCLASGFDAHATKPIQRQRLLALVREATPMRRAAPRQEAPRPSSPGMYEPRTLWERLGAWCLAPSERQDRDAVRRAGIVLGFSAAPLPVLALTAWMAPRVFPESIAQLFNVQVQLVGVLCVALLWMLRRGASMYVIGTLTLAYACVPIATFTYHTGGTKSCFAAWIATLPVWAHPIVGAAPARRWAMIAFTALAGLFVAELLGLEPPRRMFPQQVPLAHFMSIAGLSVMFFLLALVYESAKRDSMERLSQLNAELERTRDLANAARDAKDRFLATVSHEMRTPMTAILGFCQLLREAWDERPPTVGEARPLLARVEQNGAHLLQLVNDVLDLSKLEAGRVELERLPVPLSELYRELHDFGQEYARLREVDLDFQLDEATLPGHVEADPIRLRQLGMKLLAGAIDSAPKSGITFRLAHERTAQGSALALTVGPQPQSGLAGDWLGHWDGPDESGGLLSFMLVRALCAQMAGHAELRDVPRVGSTLVLRLPLDACGPGQALLASQRPGIGPERGDAIAGLRILLAEDSADSQRLIALLLRRAGARVELASDGRQAVEAARAALAEEPFDVVLMDMHMPLLDGAAATRLLRDASYPGAIVALTADATREARERCLAIGCDDFAVKPIDRDTLLATLRRVVEARRLDSA